MISTFDEKMTNLFEEKLPNADSTGRFVCGSAQVSQAVGRQRRL
jgi:hypothetical protein